MLRRMEGGGECGGGWKVEVDGDGEPAGSDGNRERTLMNANGWGDRIRGFFWRGCARDFNGFNSTRILTN